MDCEALDERDSEGFEGEGMNLDMRMSLCQGTRLNARQLEAASESVTERGLILTRGEGLD